MVAPLMKKVLKWTLPYPEEVQLLGIAFSPFLKKYTDYASAKYILISITFFIEFTFLKNKSFDSKILIILI